jgi:hypothetical protein
MRHLLVRAVLHHSLQANEKAQRNSQHPAMFLAVVD